jgi:hypothetical protein
MKKNVFFKAGILLLSLLLLPGIVGCGAVSSLMATPMPTNTPIPTATLTPTSLLGIDTPILLENVEVNTFDTLGGNTGTTSGTIQFQLLSATIIDSWGNLSPRSSANTFLVLQYEGKLSPDSGLWMNSLMDWIENHVTLDCHDNEYRVLEVGLHLASSPPSQEIVFEIPKATTFSQCALHIGQYVIQVDPILR